VLWHASQDSPSVGEVIIDAWAAADLVVWHDKQAPETGCNGFK